MLDYKIGGEGFLLAASLLAVPGFLGPTPRPARGTPAPVAPKPQASRNGPCPCGSGKKFKKCCRE